MDSPLTFHARREPWQFFATLTFARTPEPPAPARLRMVFAWLRKLARAYRLPWTGIFWLAREEGGEIGGRNHYHVLVSGLPPRAVSVSTNFVLKNLWEHLDGGGIARVYIYNPRLSGVDYVLKGFEDGARGVRNAAGVAYEIEKYSRIEAGSEMLIPARAWLEKCKRDAEPNRRQRRAREMRSHQRDRSHRGLSVKTWEPARFLHPADQVGRVHVS
jgi:hypothetical protein